MAEDLNKGKLVNPQSLIQYAYCCNNPIILIDLDGKAWTEQDEIVYQYLLSKVTSKSQLYDVLEFQSIIMNSTDDYIKAQDRDDWIEMNNARYTSVLARQLYYPMFYSLSYVDTYDYTHGMGNEFIFLGVHEVKKVIPTGNYHTTTMIFVTPDSDFYNQEKFLPSKVKPELWGGKIRYATIGADSGFFNRHLTARINRQSDVDLSIKVEMQPLVIGTDTVSEINLLFSLQKSFDNYMLTYWFFPSSSDDGYVEAGVYYPDLVGPVEYDTYNSNSFTSGLLREAGISAIEPTHSVVGWNRPVPTESFKN